MASTAEDDLVWIKIQKTSNSCVQWADINKFFKKTTMKALQKKKRTHVDETK